jgi:penicillin amidase
LSPADYPLEFKILDYAPEPWSPLKSALFLMNMAESLCSGHSDVPATNAKTLLGEELFAFLYPERNPRQRPIIPRDVPFDFEPRNPFPAPEQDNLVGMTFPHDLMESPHPNNGSNNWAVGPEKTASGNPILCSDPHLGLTLPSIWYEVHINTPALNAYGVSLPSEPGILIGFNDHIAWGETNVGHDVMDWYRIDWADENKTSYYLDGEVVEVDMRYDTIRVKGGKEVVEATKYTVWGPVVYEDTTSLYYDLAMRWIPLEKPGKRDFYELGTFWRLKKARNHADYRAALMGYDSPAQNFVFASTEGDVAITVNGKFPVKRDQPGRFVQSGAWSANGWNGFIPREQVPHVLNPERGFVASANQHSTDADYPYYYNAGFDDYRGRQVVSRLDSLENITVQDMMEMQNSSYGLYAKEALAAIIPLLDESTMNEAEQDALQTLREWDHYYRYEARAPAILDILDDSI